MIDLPGWQSPTRFVGLIAYLFAATCCGIAWTAGRGIPRRAHLAAVLALLEVGLLLDKVFSVRWQLHDLMEGEAIRENLYRQRSGPQLVAMGLLGAVAVAGMGLAFQRLRGRTGATVAACGAILSLSFWCTEVISLHAIDRVLHHMVKGVMLVSLCWVAFSVMTGLGILWDARSARSQARSAVAEQTPPVNGNKMLPLK
jgi:hypothetical protein